MTQPSVFADLQNADPQGRVRLICAGTVLDLAQQHIRLNDGLQLTLYCEDMEVDGVVRFSNDEQIWVAVIDWQAIRRKEPDIVGG